MTQDPMQQFASPYVAMGNNPVSMIDPDGRYSSRYGVNYASHYGYPYSPHRDPSSVPVGTLRYFDMFFGSGKSTYDPNPAEPYSTPWFIGTPDYLSTNISNELWMALSDPGGYGMERYTASLTPDKVAQLSEGDRRSLEQKGYITRQKIPRSHYIYQGVGITETDKLVLVFRGFVDMETTWDIAAASSGAGDLTSSWGWSFSRDLAVTEIDGGHGYSEETGTVRFNGRKGAFVAQGRANGVEASFSIANLSAFKTTNKVKDLQDLKGKTISFNVSIGMLGVSVFTDYQGPYEALGQQYIGVRLGLGSGFGFSTTISDMWKLNEY